MEARKTNRLGRLQLAFFQPDRALHKKPLFGCNRLLSVIIQ